MRYSTITAFDNEFKRLAKHFRTLPDDFEALKRYAVGLRHASVVADKLGIEEIPGFVGEGYAAFKVRKFACRALPNRGKQSGLRVIYVFQPPDYVTFVEIYFKADNENENRNRLADFIKHIQPPPEEEFEMPPE